MAVISEKTPSEIVKFLPKIRNIRTPPDEGIDDHRESVVSQGTHPGAAVSEKTPSEIVKFLPEIRNIRTPPDEGIDDNRESFVS